MFNIICLHIVRVPCQFYCNIVLKKKRAFIFKSIKFHFSQFHKNMASG